MSTHRGVLLLNFSYEALTVVSFQRAVRLLYQKKAEIVEAHNEDIRSEKMCFPLPSVIRMLYYIKNKRKSVPLTKRNVLLRDNCKCAYCNAEYDATVLTVDHVIPKSKGGSSTWANLVACCRHCNQRKRDRTPEEAGMPLKRKPHKPSFIPFVTVKRHTTPNEWAKYLFWNLSIEERPV